MDAFNGVVEVINEETFKVGWDAGIENCAASPWTWRTDTGDATGKVVENAELPEGKEEDPWCMLFHCGNFKYQEDFYVVAETMYRGLGNEKVLSLGGGVREEDWLRKHLIAYAEIQGGK